MEWNFYYYDVILSNYYIGELNELPVVHYVNSNRTFLVSRHNRVVNAIIDGIKSKRVPLPVGRRNNDLPADRKIHNVEF